MRDDATMRRYEYFTLASGSIVFSDCRGLSGDLAYRRGLIASCLANTVG